MAWAWHPPDRHGRLARAGLQAAAPTLGSGRGPRDGWGLQPPSAGPQRWPTRHPRVSLASGLLSRPRPTRRPHLRPDSVSQCPHVPALCPPGLRPRRLALGCAPVGPLTRTLPGKAPALASAVSTEVGGWGQGGSPARTRGSQEQGGGRQEATGVWERQPRLEEGSSRAGRRSLGAGLRGHRRLPSGACPGGACGGLAGPLRVCGLFLLPRTAPAPCGRAPSRGLLSAGSAATPQPLATASLLSGPIDWPTLDMSSKQSHDSWPFASDFLSPSVVLSRLIRGVANTRPSPLPVAGRCPASGPRAVHPSTVRVFFPPSAPETNAAVALHGVRSLGRGPGSVAAGPRGCRLCGCRVTWLWVAWLAVTWLWVAWLPGQLDAGHVAAGSRGCQVTWLPVPWLPVPWLPGHVAAGPVAAGPVAAGSRGLVLPGAGGCAPEGVVFLLPFFGQGPRPASSPVSLASLT